MPRIRSIKPEFATDPRILTLSDSCTLFFILLKNHCDDEGKIQNDAVSISKKVARWHKGKVQLFINSLTTAGLLRVNSTSTWLQVVDWSDQKINKPQQPIIRAIDLEWITGIDSRNNPTPLQEHYLQGKESNSKGKESEGEEAHAPDSSKKIEEKNNGPDWAKTRTLYEFPLDDLEKAMLESQAWHQGVAMKYRTHKLHEEDVRDWIRKFIYHLRGSDVQSKPLHDAKDHFNNWLNIQLERDGKSTTKNRSNNIRDRDHTDQTGTTGGLGSLG